MKKLSRKQIVYMHEMLVNETGGTQGIRDNGLLESAINAPFQTFDGEYLYKSIQLKATKLTFFLIKNHPFVDGNKRIGLLTMITFLELNGVEIICTDEELIELGVGLASSDIKQKSLLNWIIEHSH